nr:ORF56 [Bracoviriform inaniti]
MDSMNTPEYRMVVARKILKINKVLIEKQHFVCDHNYIKKLHLDKKRLQAELRFMCRKVVMLNDEIIAALNPE